MIWEEEKGKKKLADINAKLYMIFPYVVTCYYVTYGCVGAQKSVSCTI